MLWSISGTPNTLTRQAVVPHKLRLFLGLGLGLRIWDTAEDVRLWLGKVRHRVRIRVQFRPITVRYPPFRSVNYHILVKSGTRRSRSVPPFRKLYQPAIRRAKLQSNCHHQQTNTHIFTGWMPFLSPNQQCRVIHVVRQCNVQQWLCGASNCWNEIHLQLNIRNLLGDN